MELPKRLFSGYWGKCHCQGIAVDPIKGFIYYSFTTRLVKTDFDGKTIGYVDGLLGHLGCIDFNDRDGKVYGSLEFKNDSIGKGILSALGEKRSLPDAFYCAVFDVDAIVRPAMDAEKDGVMRAVYLTDVVRDYNAKVCVNGINFDHRYGCSGIDGTGWGYVPGTRDYRLMIAYGIYGDTERPDNDYQVILSFDAADWWNTYARPLCQSDMHRSGPEQCEKKYFLYTGNTEWGIQNLEYDVHTGNWLVAVYPGHKRQFSNPPMFVIDGARSAVTKTHTATGEKIDELHLLRYSYFPLGSTGMYAVGDGKYYFSESGCDSRYGQYSDVALYESDGVSFSKIL